MTGNVTQCENYFRLPATEHFVLANRYLNLLILKKCNFIIYLIKHLEAFVSSNVLRMSLWNGGSCFSFYLISGNY